MPLKRIVGSSFLTLFYFLVTSWVVLLHHTLWTWCAASPQAQNQWDHLIVNWNLWSCEPKWAVSFYNLVVSGICYSDGEQSNLSLFLPLLPFLPSKAVFTIQRLHTGTPQTLVDSCHSPLWWRCMHGRLCSGWTSHSLLQVLTMVISTSSM
jgi:hypothetical protein